MIDTIVILASGQGLRMGNIGKAYAKCSIPIGASIPIIKNLSYISQNKIKNVIILVNEKNILEIKSLINSRDWGKTKILCTTRFNSSEILESLKNVSDFLSGRKFFVMLGDVFYLQNPIPNKIKSLDGDILYGTLVKNSHEISKGGIIVTNKNGKIIKISKRGIKTKKKNYIYYRWSGMALCTNTFNKDLQDLISSTTSGDDLFLESIFEYRRRKYKKIIFEENSDFINLNTPSHLLLANLTLASESIPYASSKTRELIEKTTKSIMEDIVNISPEQL